MLDYTNHYKKTPSLQQRGLERVFEAHYTNTLEGFNVIVDGLYEKKALIQKHSNPLNSHLEDKYFTILKSDRDGVKWGSYIDGYEDKRYIVLTLPESTDGVTLKSKIRKITDTCLFTFEDGSKYAYDCIDTNYLLYDDNTYTTDTKVFEEDERKAVVVPYNEVTSKLRVIDDVRLGRHNYRIIKIDFITEFVNGVEEGVVQLVLIRTTFGELFCNDEPLRGIVRFSRMKDKIVNSKSRELITDHNQVKSGDYIKHTYQRDGQGNMETRNYIVRSLVDMHLDYDVTYMLNCDAEFYLWDDHKKERIMIPCYVEDNRTRFEDSDKTNLALADNQFQIIVQENEFTKKLGKQIDRILIKGDAYEIVGTDNLSLENAIYVGLSNSKVDPNRDNIELGIGDFKAQYTEQGVNPPIGQLDILGNDDPIIGCECYFYVDYTGKVNWTLDSTDLATVVSATDTEITIRIKNDTKIIGETLILKGEINGVFYTKELVILGWVI